VSATVTSYTVRKRERRGSDGTEKIFFVIIVQVQVKWWQPLLCS